MPNLDEIDPNFVADLDGSRQAEFAMLDYFARQGKMVVRPPQFLRPTPEERVDYADTGDLFVGNRWEVKHRTFDFQTLEDFPYPDVFIDPVSTFEQKRPRPEFYAICNKTITRAVIINVKKSFEHWIKRNDTSHGRSRIILCCPKQHFWQIVELKESKP